MRCKKFKLVFTVFMIITFFHPLFWTPGSDKRDPIQLFPFVLFLIFCVRVFSPKFIKLTQLDFEKFIFCLDNWVNESNSNQKRNIWGFNIGSIFFFFFFFFMQILHKHLLLKSLAWNTHNYNGIVIFTQRFGVN